ncbi:uncharacterized protein LOC111706456 isoform X2 [Eurytemora carolleeae]|uniref:uncharacterized protein LOC111706456 isoform X2 n=1 Tax=Eurytemora carolleeae TaxID=1294199 RepID=UPI000C760FF5|nr:uncharacterized protein LOC111706456 isoform X2 [Eurytemora carolleeae]|eukprot:XP_023335104.1 uncharacterized protein LOC111706456 isoform X2 [Eurytemora affinis]
MVSVEKQGFTPIPLNSPKDAPEYHDEPHRGDTTHPLEGARMEVMSPERLEISTPLDTPRDVFPDEELARPRSRGESVRDSFRIPLSSEVYVRKDDKLVRQRNLLYLILILLSTTLVLGILSSIYYYYYSLQDSAEWHLRVSQLGIVFGIFILAILVNLGCLAHLHVRSRRNRRKWSSMETDDF